MTDYEGIDPPRRSNAECAEFMRNALETMERVSGNGGPNIGTIGLSPETVRGVLGSIDELQKTLGALAAHILQDDREALRDWARTVPLTIDDDGEPRVAGQPRRSPPPLQALEQLPPELDEAPKQQMRRNARERGKLEAFGQMSDEWVANRVRMLLRDEIWHEPICQAARDRIMRLSMQLTEARWTIAEVRKEVCAVKPDWARALRIMDHAVAPESPPSERCHFRAFGRFQCEKAQGHSGDHTCQLPAGTGTTGSLPPGPTRIAAQIAHATYHIFDDHGSEHAQTGVCSIEIPKREWDEWNRLVDLLGNDAHEVLHGLIGVDDPEPAESARVG